MISILVVKKRCACKSKQQPEIFYEKKVFLKEACNFIKKEALVLVFSCEFCEIFKSAFLTEHLWTTAPANHVFE